MKRYTKPVTLLVFTVVLMATLAVTAFAAGQKLQLTAVNTLQGVRLEWSECEGVYYYEVYRQTGSKGEKLLLSKAQTTSYEDTLAKEGKTYNYTVVPVFSDYSQGEESEKATLFRLSAVSISAAGSQRNGIYLKWNSVKNAKGYRVYRRTVDDSEWSTVAKFTAGENTYTDGEISPGQVYVYCVKAFMGEYESAAANEKELSYTSFPVVKGVANTDEGVIISWEECSEAVYYVVYRKTGEEASYKPYALLDANFTEYTDTGAVSGQMSSYHVCSVDERGNFSSFDRELDVRFIKKSVITAAVNTVKGVKLYWNKSEGCQGYAVFRKAFGEKNWKLRGVIYGDNKLSAVDSKVADGKVYTYTVRAFRDKFMSTYDEQGVSLKFYSAPTKLICKADGDKGYLLSWKKSDTVEAYAVYRKEGNSDWVYLATVYKDSFSDKSVDAKKKYIYGVEAYEGSVLHSGRAEVSAKAKSTTKTKTAS